MNAKNTPDNDAYSDAQIRQENEKLKKQLGIMMNSQYSVKEIDPRLENRFLRYIQDFEEMEKGPKKKIRTLFPNTFTFPPIESMNLEELKLKCNEICEILAQHDIILELQEACPDFLWYDFIINEVLDDLIPVRYPKGMRYHITGCDGYCPGCFQRVFCEAGEEAWPFKEDKPGESDGSISPSFSPVVLIKVP